jgi:hypothetical protein
MDLNCASIISTALQATRSTDTSLIPRTILYTNPSSPSALHQIAELVTTDPKLSSISLSSFIQCDGTTLVNVNPFENDQKFNNEEFIDNPKRACLCAEHSALGLDSSFETAVLFSNFTSAQKACDSLRSALVLQQRKEEKTWNSFDYASSERTVPVPSSLDQNFQRCVHLLLVSDIDLCFQHIESPISDLGDKKLTHETHVSNSPPLPFETSSSALSTLFRFATCSACFNPTSTSAPAVMVIVSARHAKLVPPWLFLPKLSTKLSYSNDSTLSYTSIEPLLLDINSLNSTLDTTLSAITKSRVDIWLKGSRNQTDLSVGVKTTNKTINSQSFTSIAGYESIKERLYMSVVHPLQDCLSAALKTKTNKNHSSSSLFSNPPLEVECSSKQKGNLRVSPLRGLLLHGPSGCGKTLLARALAAEANLALIHVQCPQLLSRFVGDSEAGLREVFRTARSMAPSLLLLDDIDSIAKARSGLEFNLGVSASTPITQSSGSNAVLERLLSTLLNELDGIGQRSESSSSHLPILVVGTCSASAKLDSALLRSGRLEMNICVHFPEFFDRLAILNMSALNVKLTKEAELFLPEVAKCLENKTCSEVKDVISEAGLIALKEFKSEIGVEELRKFISSEGIKKVH